MCWPETKEQLFQMSWGAGIGGYLAYLFFLRFNRADLPFDYVFLSNDPHGRECCCDGCQSSYGRNGLQSQSHVA